ncbi:hypothetical protein LGN06_28785, partial [Burkholderia vietnamiensis]|nr:hypothetical protein [Burkholderia vietnamiensis]
RTCDGDGHGSLRSTWLTGSVNLNAPIMRWKNQHRETVRPSRLLSVWCENPGFYRLHGPSFRKGGAHELLALTKMAAAMANYASTRTTQLYDRCHDDISLDEVERICL